MTDQTDLVSKGFQEYINSHGFGFQHAVMAKALEVYSLKSPWRYPVPEFPVKIQDANTRIDVIFQHAMQPWFIVAECKRVNPSLGNWCFMGSSIYRDYEASHGLILERQVFSEPSNYSEVFHPTSIAKVYFVAGEVKTNVKGDPCTSGRGAIEDAATQVLRSVNGLIEYLRSCPKVRNTMKHAVFVPVIFTTANLYVTDVDLQSADLLSGNIDVAKSLTKTDCVVYQYPQSPTFKHSLSVLPQLKKEDNVLIDSLYSEYVRSIMVVSASGISDFLQWDLWRRIIPMSS